MLMNKLAVTEIIKCYFVLSHAEGKCNRKSFLCLSRDRHVIVNNNEDDTYLTLT